MTFRFGKIAGSSTFSLYRFTGSLDPIYSDLVWVLSHLTPFCPNLYLKTCFLDLSNKILASWTHYDWMIFLNCFVVKNGRVDQLKYSFILKCHPLVPILNENP